MRKIVFVGIASMMFLSVSNIVYGESVPEHIQKLVFESSDFAEPIILSLPPEDRNSKEMVLKWARDGGLPPAVLWAGNDLDKSVLNFLIRNGFAIVERFEYRLTITPDFQQAYNFLLYTDKIKPYIKKGTIEEGFSVIAAHRKLQSIADIDRHWEKDEYGFKREVFLFSFLYTLEEDFPNLPKIKRLYRGRATLCLDTAISTEWRFSSPISLEDGRGGEYMDLLDKQFGTEEIHVQPLTREATQRKETLDYTKEAEVENGLHLVLKVDCSRLPSGAHRDVVQKFAKIIANRLALVFYPQMPWGVYIAGNDRIIVQLPLDVFDRERILAIIGRTACLEFKLVSDKPEDLRKALDNEKVDGYELKYIKTEHGGEEPLLILTEASFTGEVIANASVGGASRDISLMLNPKGADIFAKVTAANVGKRLAIVLDGKMLSAPVIRETIPSDQSQIKISSGLSHIETCDLAAVLTAGALPAPVMIEEERTISGVIGFDFQDTQGIIVEAVFPTPIIAENLKNKLDSMGISGYIQMLGREEKKYLIWLKTSPAQAEKAIKELVKNNSGDLLRIEAVSERIKPDLEIDSLSKSESFQEELKSKEKQPPYFVVIEGKQYKVGGDIFTGKKEGRVFKDEKGTIVRDLVLAKKIAQAAWVYENIVRPSGPPRSQQVSAILDTYKALRRYEVAQDILARASVQILAATISGGTTLTYTVPAGLTWRVIRDQFVNLKGLLSLTGRQGLEEALSKYQQMESLMAKLKPNHIDEAAAAEIKRLYDAAYVSDLPYSALLASLMPKKGRELVDKALKDIGDELVRTLPLSDPAISDAVLTNRELFDLQGKMEDALKAVPALKEYYEKLDLAKRLTEANEQVATAWAEQAVGYKE